MTAEDAQARLEQDVKRAKEATRVLAEDFQRYRRDAHTTLVRMQEEINAVKAELARLRGEPMRAEGVDVNDGKPWVCERHLPIQHRDRRPPWCNACGRGVDGALVGVPAWLARLAREGELCGAPSEDGPCLLLKGHNMGQLDIPSNHQGGYAPEREAQP